MNLVESRDYLGLLRKELRGLLIITTIVSLKLILSFVFPSLKTPGELIWTGLILLVFTLKAFATYNKTKL